MFPHVLGHFCRLQQDRDTGTRSSYLCLPSCCGMEAERAVFAVSSEARSVSAPLPVLCSGIACCVERPVSTKL